ncbi:prolyl oligopeptidase family serine peptidase [Candidatus Mycobacterium wuenschmannii]|uniref:Prolyl oligopeptidase family serine peptidase n=1 Tax=Candidatus Mycobacterium wuenschmannii TaxID=3027808 RepID=A0ABY8VWY1_9MYCO|nr:prolyl oligopeptidase family serine peptidase [Candidatus Mycobacterium wuenschmannii]WIM88093.1 prolyl oligopeptidase family serine peptidase [Candidatus Mycobacterium wuenschmannii]
MGLSQPPRCSRRAALAAAGGCVMSLAGWATARSRADDGDRKPARLDYGQLPSQYVDITLPSGTSPAPVALIIHGGFWSNGFGADLGRPLADDLARRGFAAVNVEYRRVGVGPNGGGGWPQTGADLAAALAALGGDGQRMANGRLDLGRVVGLGHSAGGQLAAWLAAQRAGVRLSGVVSQAGVLDMVQAAETGVGGGAVEDFLGGSPAQVPAAYADASPIARVPLGAPSICVHGRSDSVVPIEQSERFVTAARGAGDRRELRAFDGGHFDPIAVGSPAWSLCVQALSDLTGR